MSNIREIREVDVDCCRNCCSLRWGKDEGWDWCDVNKVGIDWSTKGRTVCDLYVRSALKDPRNFGRDNVVNVGLRVSELKLLSILICDSKVVVGDELLKKIEDGIEAGRN